jgi:hypothetical protein
MQIKHQPRISSCVVLLFIFATPLMVGQTTANLEKRISALEQRVKRLEQSILSGNDITRQSQQKEDGASSNEDINYALSWVGQYSGAASGTWPEEGNTEPNMQCVLVISTQNSNEISVNYYLNNGPYVGFQGGPASGTVSMSSNVSLSGRQGNMRYRGRLQRREDGTISGTFSVEQETASGAHNIKWQSSFTAHKDQ